MIFESKFQLFVEIWKWPNDQTCHSILSKNQIFRYFWVIDSGQQKNNLRKNIAIHITSLFHDTFLLQGMYSIETSY